MKRATRGCKSGIMSRPVSCAIAIGVALAWSLGSVAKVEAGHVVSPASPYPGPGAPSGGPDPQYDFTFNDGQGNSGFGMLNAIDPGLGDGSFWALSGTLTVTSGADIGAYNLVTSATTNPFNSPDGNWIADNLIYPANNAGSGVNNGSGGAPIISNPSLLDFFGLLFGGTIGGDTIFLNIYSNDGGGDYSFGSSINGFTTINTLTGGSFTLTSVPEPASLSMLAAGIACVAGYGWRRRKPAVAWPRD
jgi:PEP-CTERM motif